MVQFSQCIDCKNYINNNEGIYKCRAFPEGIPNDIFWNKIDHNNNIDGDKGIKFEAVEGYYGKQH